MFVLGVKKTPRARQTASRPIYYKFGIVEAEGLMTDRTCHRRRTILKGTGVVDVVPLRTLFLRPRVRPRPSVTSSPTRTASLPDGMTPRVPTSDVSVVDLRM